MRNHLARFAARSAILSPLLFSQLFLLPNLRAEEPTNEPPFTVVCDHADGVYLPGQTVHWKVEATKATAASPLEKTYAIKQGGLTVLREGRLDLTNGVAEIDVTNVQSGTLLLDIRLDRQKDRRTKVLGGVVVAPENIVPSASRPKDFDAFWQAKLDELLKIPPDAQLVSKPSERKEVDYWEISLANIHGARARGQLARPTAGGKFPAMLVMEAAGVHGLKKEWVTKAASRGWLALDVNAHDLPIDQPQEFYDQQSQGALKEYWTIGNDDRDKSYFLQMYLGCYRAAQYLVERPDWDGKTLLMIGTSQGGLQALMMAGLHPKATAVIACVPAGCDMTGPQVGRSPGWPAWYYKTRDKDPAKVIEASRYFDVVNFASRIQCPALVGLGLIDETCPPAGIFVAMNQVKGLKEIVIMPQAGHMEINQSQRSFHNRSRIWQDALVTGQPAPVGK